jgi:excisionase family DNA binding protein
MPDILTAEEAAEYLQISPGMLLAGVRAGVIPGAKIGRYWRFSQRQLLAWVEDQGEAEAEDREMAAAIREDHGEPEDQ